MLLKANRSALIVVDVQERLLPAMLDAESVVGRIRVLKRAAQRLSVPLIVTEHCPQRLGRTVAEISEREPPESSPDSVVEKTHFAAGLESALQERLAVLGRDQIVLAGIESHVCVLQTALSLQEQDRRCFVVADAVTSRHRHSVDTALDRLRFAGIEVVTTEMVVFEWLERAATPAFRDLLPLLR